MITKRIIPCLDVRDGRVVKGVNFTGLNDVSSPVELAKLMRKMGRKDGAIGFAVYLDELEHIAPEDEAPDADVLLLYDESRSPAEVCRKARELADSGKRVLVQRSVPAHGRFGEILRLTDKEGGDA